MELLVDEIERGLAQLKSDVKDVQSVAEGPARRELISQLQNKLSKLKAVYSNYKMEVKELENDGEKAEATKKGEELLAEINHVADEISAALAESNSNKRKELLASSGENREDHEMTADEYEDLEQTNQQISDVERANNEATRRILAKAKQTEDLGNESAQQLKRQGEQLQGMEQDMDHLESNLELSDRIVKKMESVLDFFLDLIGFSKPIDMEKEKEKKMQERAKVDAEAREKRNKLREQKEEEERKALSPSNAEPDDMDLIGSVVGRIKSIGIDIGEELKSQNERVEKLTEKSEKNEAKLQNLNKRVEKL